MTDGQSDAIGRYFAAATEQLQTVLETQRTAMEAVAELWVETIRNDGMIYSFGSGHSRFIAGEIHWRAGGLAPVMAIDDPANGAAERLEGYAATFMNHYAIKAGDVLVVVSNSGINAVPVEVALYGKNLGAKVVALTALSHSQTAKSRHSSGKKLYEVADVSLDTMGVYGDAVVELPGVNWRVAPTSTLVSVAILNAIVARTAEKLLQAGQTPPVLISANVPEGDQMNQQMSDRYWQRLARFPRRRASG
jgi:uncharacterized phosphosugar-binding protein